MDKTTTVEVDPGELSDEVVEELVEEGEISEEEAEEWGDRVWVDEAMDDNTERMGSLEYLSNRFERGRELLYTTGVVLKNVGVRIVKGLDSFTGSSIELLRNVKTTAAVVDDVNVDSSAENVVLDIEHDAFGSGSVSLGLDSAALSNLLEYKSVENPMDLVGESVFVRPRSFADHTQTIMIPHNVSLSGKVRFRVFGAVEEVREKTRMRFMFETLGSYFEIFGFTGFIAFLAAIIGDPFFASPSGVISFIGALLLVPISLWAISLGFTILYFSYWIVVSVLYYIIRSDFIEAEA